MKKVDMIQIDSTKITDEIKHNYLEYYETILETIKETYRCSFYLEGLNQHFGNYKCSGEDSELLIKDIIKLLKQKICLNINKLIIDEGNDVLTIYKMQNYIRENLKVNIYESHINTKLEVTMRDNFICHNLHTDKSCSVDIRDLKPLLNKIYEFFQKLWIKNFVDDSLFIADGYFDFLRDYCIKAVKKSFMAIQP